MRALLAVIVALSTSAASYAADKTKTSKANRQKAANNQKEVFKFMSFLQVAQLEHTQRLKYVTALRQSAIEIEKMQFMFRDSIKDASLEKVKEYNRLYAMIMGEPAEAQTEPVGNSGGRGRSPADKCIFGYNLSKYPTDKKRQPFECEVPPDRECSGGGVRCGDFLSGLGAGLANNCISRASRHIATQACDQIRRDLSNKNDKDISNAVDNADKFFGFHDQKPTLTKDDMSGKEAKKILTELAKHAYDDRAYAQLIYVLGLYKKSGIEVRTIVGLGDVYGKLLDPSLFEKSFNEVQTAINQIFGDYLAHCNSPVPDDEIDTLVSAKWSSQYDKIKMNEEEITVGMLEKERIEAARAFKAGNGKRKVEDITEIRECRAIRARINNIAQIINRTRGSYPNPNGPGPAPVQPTPDPVAVNPKPTGCTSNVTSEKHHLYQDPAKCMICMTDRAVVQSINSNDSNEQKKAKENYSTSTKWMSLLSTMALACGDGANGRYLTVDVLDRYRQMFGHCSDKTYKWEGTYQLTDDDKTLIEDWSNAEMWSGKKKWRKNPADADNDFTRVYGIKYETATKMFCNMDRFKVGALTGKIRQLREVSCDNEKMKRDDSFCPTKKPQGELINNRRKQFLAYLDGDKRNGEAVVSPDKKIDSVADDLLKCLNESAETAKTLYSEAGQGVSCTMSKKMDGNHDTEFAAMVNGVKAGGGAIIYNSGKCFVAKHIEKYKNTEIENIGFTFPTDVVHKSGVYDLAYENDGQNKLPKIVSAPSLKQKNRELNILCPTGQTNTDNCEDLNSMSFLYPNPGICSVASSNKQASPAGESH